MKTKEDIGLKHVQELGIVVKRSIYDVFSVLSLKFGDKEADEFMIIMRDTQKGSPDFYKFKDSDYEKAMIFSGSFDADIIRKTCSWIHENRSFFGN